MTTLDTTANPTKTWLPQVFTLTVFVSAALVFMVEPMVAKIMLPLLGGGPSIWNTSLAFFQVMLLFGYGYAHLLQRIASIRTQGLIHGTLLALAALVLPLRVLTPFGPPDFEHPALWLLGALLASIGAPFAILSATAPLAQSWHARLEHAQGGVEPYPLYAASNLGSLLALLAYPAIVEPFTPLHGQTLGWSFAYGGFVVLIGALMLNLSRRVSGSVAIAQAQAQAPTSKPSWNDRLIWVLLAAVPSSLMLGVTTYITTDVASAPFLWVIPLALYLATFIFAFASRQVIPSTLALTLQGAALAACVAVLPFSGSNLATSLPLHLSCFFLTALVCHQALVARRPDPAHLTEFYLWMSFGGVVGGGFNAFLAPILFNGVWEYPLVLALSCLALPWGRGRVETWRWLILLAGVACALAALYLALNAADPVWLSLNILGTEGAAAAQLFVKLLLAGAVVSAFLIRSRAWLFFVLIAIITITAAGSGDRVDVRTSWRSFFGVLIESRTFVPGLGGEVKMLAHGTTLHGAQAVDPRYRCRPLLYYAPETPIGQVFSAVRASKPAIRIGAVGLGTGAVATYVRPTDHLTFFEIDPLVIRIASDPKHFSYTSECAKGPVNFIVGDARLTLARQPPGTFDILLIDAFSSDSVPAHLLTVEALRGYLAHLKPDGVLVLHLSNRNLDLKGPAMAAAAAAGGVAMLQEHPFTVGAPLLWESAEDALVISHDAKALAEFVTDPRWKMSNPHKAKAWTDDYTNIAGAMITRLRERLRTGA